MRKVWLYAGIGVVALIALIAVTGVWMMRSFMRPADTRAEDLEELEAGQPLEVIGQIVALDGDTLTVEVLEGNGYDRFDQRTGRFLTLTGYPDAEVVMGDGSDVVVGAIAQFEGTTAGADRVQLERIVILTGYVTGPE